VRGNILPVPYPVNGARDARPELGFVDTFRGERMVGVSR